MRRAIDLARHGRVLAQAPLAEPVAWHSVQQFARFATDDGASDSSQQSGPGSGRGRGTWQPGRFEGRPVGPPAPGAPRSQLPTQQQDAASGSQPPHRQRAMGRGRAAGRLADNLALQQDPPAQQQGADRQMQPPGAPYPSQMRRPSPRRPPQQREGGNRPREGGDRPRPSLRPEEGQRSPRQEMRRSSGPRPPRQDIRPGDLRPAGAQPIRETDSAVRWQHRQQRPRPAFPARPRRFPAESSGDISRDRPRQQRAPQAGFGFGDDEDELSEQQLDERRAEYMGWDDPALNEAVEEAFREQEALRQEAKAAAAAETANQLTPEDVARFTDDDWVQVAKAQELVAEAKEAGMLPSERQVKMIEQFAAGMGRPQPDDDPRDMDFKFDREEMSDFHRLLEMDYDQEYQVPIGGLPQRRTADERDPEKVLEMFKGPLMEQLGIESEAEWAAQVEAALQGFEHVRPVLAGADPQEEEQTLEGLVAARMPPDHPMHPHLVDSLEMVKRNPFWPMAKKQSFINGMVKDALK